jgi:GTPase
LETYKSCIVVVNKWDLTLDRTEHGRKRFEESLRQKLKFHYYVPVMFASAHTGYNVNQLVDSAILIAHERRGKITTRKLYQIIQQYAPLSSQFPCDLFVTVFVLRSTIILAPPSKGKFKLKFRFISQALVGGGPAFIFFVNKPDLATENYMRFLESCIRREYPFTGTPLRLIVRRNENIRPNSNESKPKPRLPTEVKKKRETKPIIDADIEEVQ